MTKKEAEILQELRDSVKELYTCIVGNEQIGITGIVQRQLQDEQEWKETHETLKEINQTLKNQVTVNDELKERLETLEHFVLFFKSLGSVKKKTIAVIGGSIAALGTIINRWEQIKSAIWPH